MKSIKIKKNDSVKIIAGKESGKTGKVINIDVKRGVLTVDGLNVYKKHVKPRRQGEKGQVISVPRPMDVSNAMYLCSSCGAASKIGNRLENDKKVRYCKKCSATI